MLQVDEGAANAVNAIANQMPNEWAILEDYVARALCDARDKMETGASKERDEKAGVCQGLRHLFELRRKAANATERVEGQVKQGIDKVIIGEQEYVRYHQPHGEEL